MESFSHRHRRGAGGGPAHQTRGRLLDRGWRYDLEVWFVDTFVLRGSLRDLRLRVLSRAELRSGQAVLDVGCGTGTLAIEAAARIGAAGHVAGIDPAPRQIARARSKARRARLSTDFRVAVIEALPFADGSFDVVTSTLMMHHLPEELRRRGLSEIVRVLRPGGRLVVADFTHGEEHGGTSHWDAGDTGIHDQAELMSRAAFMDVEGEELRFPRGIHRGWTGAALVVGRSRKP